MFSPPPRPNRGSSRCAPRASFSMPQSHPLVVLSVIANTRGRVPPFTLVPIRMDRKLSASSPTPPRHHRFSARRQPPLFRRHHPGPRRKPLPACVSFHSLCLCDRLGFTPCSDILGFPCIHIPSAVNIHSDRCHTRHINSPTHIHLPSSDAHRWRVQARALSPRRIPDGPAQSALPDQDLPPKHRCVARAPSLCHPSLACLVVTAVSAIRCSRFRETAERNADAEL